MQQACRQLKYWNQTYALHTPLTLSVNVSARQFNQLNLVQHIDAILAETQFNPNWIRLEITERAILDNAKSTAVLYQLKERNIQLSIDDFGTGYSSLSYLHALPVDALKIDQSFIQRMNTHTDDIDLVSLIIDIAHAMKMTVVAEGIETPAQLSRLQELACEFGQGYLFSKPLEPEGIECLLTQSCQVV